MKKLIALFFCLTLLLGGCNSSVYVNSLALGELVDNGNYEQISNQIPQWVMNTEWNTPFYAATSSDITMFDAYAKENSPSFCDAQWTQEQSDAVYLGNRIFSNIISNALKYSDGDLSVVMDKNGCVTFSNTAHNLNAVTVGRLFDRFYTVEASRNSTGLGLSIAKLLIERMGGNIEATYNSDKLQIKIIFAK